MKNPLINQMLEQIANIHDKKNSDYTDAHPYENFDRSKELISWFKSDEDKVFVTFIGTKLARLATLLNNNKEPLNESIEDSFLDLTTYCILWANRRKYRKLTNT